MQVFKETQIKTTVRQYFAPVRTVRDVWSLVCCRWEFKWCSPFTEQSVEALSQITRLPISVILNWEEFCPLGAISGLETFQVVPSWGREKLVSILGYTGQQLQQRLLVPSVCGPAISLQDGLGKFPPQNHQRPEWDACQHCQHTGQPEAA